jgi:DNA invertase Pin-like site-specific DNA recombinase
MAQKEDRETSRTIKDFLAREVSELGVKRRAKYLVTSPREIAEHTGLNVKTVKKYMSRIAKKRVDGKVVVRVGRTDVIVRLAGRAPRSKFDPRST